MESSAPRRAGLALGLVLLLSGLCTIHKLGNAPVWDDVLILAQAADVRAHGGALRAFGGSTLDALLGDRQDAAAQQLDLFRPLSLLSFLLGDAIGGGDPRAQHLINTALHLACVALVYALARRLARGDARVALLCAACFGLMPALTEAHVWISGRFDLLSTCFGLLALLAWRHAEDAPSAAPAARTALRGGAALCWLLGLLSKEPLLFALPALASWPGTARGVRARVQAILPLLAASAVYLGWRALALSHATFAGTGGAKPLLAAAHLPALLLDGAVHVLVPFTPYARALNEDYAALGVAGLCACAIGCAIACVLIWRARRTRPLLAWSALWFVCTLAPTALITTRLWPGFGRFLYLPASLGLTGVGELVVGAVQRDKAQLPRAALAAMLAYLALLAAVSHRAVYDWASDEALFESVIAAAPQRSHGHGFLGMTYLEHARYADAAAELGQAVRIAPDEPRWPSRLGQALLFSGQREQALTLAERSIARFGYAPEYHLLAAYAVLERDPDRTAREVLECLLQDAKHAQCLEALAFLQSQHPQAARFRESFAVLLGQPRYAALRGVTSR